MRIVSLTCSNTEIVCHLGCASMLVGVDDHSDFPPDVVAALPRVGPDLQIDVERVAALEPDLVLASLTVPGHEKVVEQVDAAGLPYLAPAPQSVADVARDLREIGAALGVASEAASAADAFLDGLEAQRRSARAPAAQAGPSVLVQWWPKPVIVPGRRSWVHDLLELVGATNVLAEDVESRPLADEELAAMDPDAVVLSWCGVEAHKVRPDVVCDHPILRASSAVRLDRVACIPEAWLGRPSPRLIHGARALRELAEAVEQGQPVPQGLASPESAARLLRQEAERNA